MGASFDGSGTTRSNRDAVFQTAALGPIVAYFGTDPRAFILAGVMKMSGPGLPRSFFLRTPPPGTSGRTGLGVQDGIGMSLAAIAVVMRVLEARFHPRRRGQPDFVMVGYLVWRGERRRERPVFEPARAALSDPLLSKLNYLVDMTEPGSFERLQTLRSEFWSFVPISADERDSQSRS